MTRYAPLWQQNATFPAATDRGLLSALWPGSTSTGGAPSLVSNTMNVQIAAGSAAVAVATGTSTEICRWDAAEVVTLAAAPASGSSRIDLVVLQVRDAALDAGSNNDFLFQAITGAVGTPGPGAVPATPTNAYPICQVLVPGGAANLNGATLTDVRRNTGLAAVPRIAMRAYRNAAFNTSTNPCPFDTVTFDTAPAYGAAYGFGKPSQGRYTCPVAGGYLVVGEIGVTAPSANFQAIGYINKNGAIAALGPQAFQPTSAFGMGMFASDIIPCVAGDILDFGSNAGSANGQTGAATTYMSVRLVGLAP